MDLQLKNKKVLVTGSTQGIGYAIASSLAKEGAVVMINGKEESTVLDACQKIMMDIPGSKAIPFVLDIGNSKATIEKLEDLDDVDVLINNAGIFEPREFVAISDEEWYKLFEINVMSAIRLSRYVFPKMLERNWGRIIFMTSESAINIPEEMIHYGMTKTALHAISRGMAELTKGTAVTVNTVMPGPTASSGMIAHLAKLAKENNVSIEEQKADFFISVRPTSLIQRFAEPQEIANMVTYLSSPLSSATNGASLRVDGGVVKSIF